MAARKKVDSEWLVKSTEERKHKSSSKDKDNYLVDIDPLVSRFQVKSVRPSDRFPSSVLPICPSAAAGLPIGQLSLNDGICQLDYKRGCHVSRMESTKKLLLYIPTSIFQYIFSTW